MNAKKIAALVLAALPALAQAQERKIIFMLDFIALGRHAPWYVPIAKGYYKQEGLDVTVVPSKGTADVIKGAEVKCLLLGDHGLDIYANGIGVKEEFLRQNPEVVRGFVRAALRGWKDALANPEEAATLQVQYVKALDPGIIVDELRIVKRL